MALVCTLPTLTDWTPIELAVADKTAANYSRTLPAWLSVFLYVCISSQSSLLPSSRPIASRLSNLSSPKTEDTQFALFSESASFHLFLLPVTRHNLPLASLPLQHTDTLTVFFAVLKDINDCDAPLGCGCCCCCSLKLSFSILFVFLCSFFPLFFSCRRLRCFNFMRTLQVKVFHLVYH